MATADQITQFVEALKNQGIEYVRFELPDLHGICRAKTVPIDKVEGYTRKGLNFYGGTLALDTSSYVVAGSGLHEEVGYRDHALFPDLESLQTLPWLTKTARVICDPYLDGQPVTISPRQILKNVLHEAAQLGFDVMIGQEFEFYILTADAHQPVFDGVHIFNHIRNQYLPFLDDLLDKLRATGVDIITHNAEYGPGQFEINFGPAIGITAADKAYTFKTAVKEIVHRAGYLATFMARPFSDKCASGCHVHISLWDRETGNNIFFDPSDADGLSKTAKAFIQGILDHGRAMMPLIAPTINCYRRYLPPSFASACLGWGIEDRTGMVRVKATKDEGTHIEMRAASSISNPYLSAAATVAAGLLGVKQARELQQPVAGRGLGGGPDLARLPASLEEGLAALGSDPDFLAMLGKDFYHLFSTVKNYELGRFRAHVTDWEKAEYLEVY